MVLKMLRNYSFGTWTFFHDFCLKHRLVCISSLKLFAFPTKTQDSWKLFSINFPKGQASSLSSAEDGQDRVLAMTLNWFMCDLGQVSFLPHSKDLQAKWWGSPDLPLSLSILTVNDQELPYNLLKSKLSDSKPGELKDMSFVQICITNFVMLFSMGKSHSDLVKVTQEKIWPTRKIFLEEHMKLASLS